MANKTRGKQVRDRTLPNALAGGKQKPLEDRLDEARLTEVRGLLWFGRLEKIATMLVCRAVDARYVARFLKDNSFSARSNAAWCLSDAAKSGTDISMVIQEIVNALNDKEKDVRRYAALALRNAAKNGTAETRDTITKAVMELQGSKWFAIEAEGNTMLYTKLLARLDKIMQAVREAEQGEAA